MAEPTNSVLLLICILFVSATLFLSFRRKKSRSHQLPPGPSGWPIFGNLFDLGRMPHRSLAGLRKKYGPLVWVRLGSIDTMVILSSRVAAEFFKNQDLNFAERTITDLMRSQDYDKGSVALAPYGTYWRVSRRLLSVDMLVAKRLNETAPIRRKCLDTMLTWIGDAASADKVRLGEGIHLARFVFLMSFNLLGNLMLSRDLLDPDSKVGSEFFAAMTGMMEWSGHVTVRDLFPWLRWLGPQGLRRKMDRDMGKAMRIASDFVRERIEEKKIGGDHDRTDFLDVLLEFEGHGKDEPAKLSEKQINTFILEMFLAGAETSSSTIEWAMTELLRDPDSMVKAQAELSRVVGSNRKVQEADIDQLPYLQAVVKETLRLHPPIPLLVPRRAMGDTVFMGYDIPENTQVFVNAWAIGRDPDVWEDPMAFKPERFIGSKLDYKGQHYEFIPFGAGRRMCAGLPLAHRVLHLALSSLLHEFDWEFDGCTDAKTIDMRDRVGMTMRKYVPLLVVPKRRAM
ncbi:cytochrome P450 76A1-like [Rhodamnia argentea]|uniref:Cytochrome P450 76A1-like n=1 Tax=Rhodamnia argentea TaxID=178133 RepID=A0A8B8QG79_9MYRT|nr:cytochrome P450 76A1-like [Rhodamnia argentea]